MIDLATIKKQASILAVAEKYKLELRRENDDEYKAVCCFHEETTPSLSFTVSTNCFYCFGCQKAGSVIDFVMYQEGSSFLDAAVRAAELAGLSAADISLEPRIVDTAIFTDENGKPLYGEHRYEPGKDGKKKSFEQFHFGPNGEEIPNLPPKIRRVLLNLPEVLAAETVFLVEGKKDVDTLRAWGFVATTKSGGAGGQWYREYTESLVGKYVIQLPDVEAADKPGAKYARQVEASLAGKAQGYLCVRVPRGKDITDFKNYGGTKEDLLELIDKANQPADSPTKRTQDIIRKRGMPQAVDSEKLILGVVMRGYVGVDEIAMLKPEDFYGANHSRIYMRLLDLQEHGGSTDTLAVTQVLKNEGLDVGDYLLEITSDLPAVFNLSWHLEAVEEAARARQIVFTASRAADSILLGGKPDDALALLEQSKALTVDRQEDGRMLSAAEIAGNLDEYFKPKPMGILSDIEGLNRLVRGLKEGKLYIVAARPGEGKSSLARQLALWAVRENHATDILSFEMGSDEVLNGIVCQAGELDGLAMNEGRLSDADKEKAANIIYRLADCPLHIDHVNDWTLHSIRTHLKQRKAAGKPVRVLIIDYLQLMKIPGKERRDLEIGHITAGLKALAIEFVCSIILLSQLSREGVKQNRKPILSDLKDSGSIEADADVVIFIWQDWSTDNEHTETRECELIVPKHRGGPTGTVLCLFKKASTLFLDR